jgi:hypothetical protein
MFLEDTSHIRGLAIAREEFWDEMQRLGLLDDKERRSSSSVVVLYRAGV